MIVIIHWKDISLSMTQSPLGSSSGSCIAVSAGLAPISLGTETIGSLVTPAVRASLFTIKPTHGLVNSTSIVPITSLYDTAGPIGKTTKDVADLMDVLVDHDKTHVPEGCYASAMVSDWNDIRIGTLDPETWRLSECFLKPVPVATKQIVCT